MTAGTTTFDLSGFRGELFYPADPGYDDARAVFNAMIDRHPVLIARCTNADDVVATVQLARRENLPMSVYGGGHGVTGAARRVKHTATTARKAANKTRLTLAPLLHCKLRTCGRHRAAEI